MRKLLGLDLSVARTGWALAAPNEPLRFGSYPLPSTGEDIGKLLVAFDEWLKIKIAGEDIAVVVFEAPILRQGRTHITTARKLMNLAGHVEFICSQLGIRCAEQNISTNKKDFTGNGHAEKQDMILMARRYGWDVKNSDEADACALWMGAVLRYAPDQAPRFKLGALGAVRAA
ncbi:hypothetical protein [Methylobacterium hispanicum]|uniref:hypothetical protein n=1 Tax=Methylobacterium hispanicum TaxID=270350 RepID=UPI002F338BEF